MVDDTSGFTYRYKQGDHRGIPYYIGVRATPTRFDPDSFAVVPYNEDETGVAVDVAKVDNTRHREGGVHVDRYYRATGAPRKDFDVDISTLDEAEAYLQANWLRFARLHDRNHR